MSGPVQAQGPTLSGTQRKYLRGLAHSLSPVVQVGRGGVNEAVLAATSRALDDHELIKVKIAASREERTRLAAEIEAGCGACLAGTIGTIAILYRPHPEASRRRIVLPGSPTNDGPSPVGDEPASGGDEPASGDGEPASGDGEPASGDGEPSSGD